MTSISRSHKAASRPKEEVELTMPVWKIIWRLIYFKKGFYAFNLFFMLILMLAGQIPSLAFREFFNLVSGDTAVTLTIPMIAFAMVLGEAVRTAGRWG